MARVSSRFTVDSLTISLAVLATSLSGCGESHCPDASMQPPSQCLATWNPQATKLTPAAITPQDNRQTPAQWREVELSSSGPSDHLIPLPTPSETPTNVALDSPKGPYWSFPTADDHHIGESYPVLIPLPAIDQPEQGPQFVVEDTTAGDQGPDELFVARLLPPRPIDSVPAIEVPEFATPQFEEPAFDEPTLAAPLSEPVEQEVVDITPTPSTPLPVIAELNEQQRLMNQLLQDSSSATTGVLTDHRIDELAKSKIQSAYAMANRGSLYVARRELIEVLRMISQARDAEAGTNNRSVALAAGFRALREAEDFVPRGTQLEAEVDLSVLCSSHRTPVAAQVRSANLPPRIMMDRYLRYAQLQLSMSVAGDPAGSMALHALGKLHSQLGRVEPENHRLANRRAVAYQQAALLAHDQNHLAAHELGVLLAKSGHFAEAQQLLTQVASREPNAIVYRNLARVQEELGQSAQAVASLQVAQELSQQGATGSSTVQWVPTTQFAQSNARSPRTPATQQMVAQRQPGAQLPIPGSRAPMTQTIRR